MKSTRAENPIRISLPLGNTADRALFGATEEVKRLRGLHLDTGHTLVGFLTPVFGILLPAGQTLSQVGVTINSIKDIKQERREASQFVKPGFTLRMKKCLEAASKKAREEGTTSISDLHILSAIIDDKIGIASGILQKLGVDKEKLQEVIKNMSS